MRTSLLIYSIILLSLCTFALGVDSVQATTFVSPNTLVSPHQTKDASTSTSEDATAVAAAESSALLHRLHAPPVRLTPAQYAALWGDVDTASIDPLFDRFSRVYNQPWTHFPTTAATRAQRCGARFNFEVSIASIREYNARVLGGAIHLDANEIPIEHGVQRMRVNEYIDSFIENVECAAPEECEYDAHEPERAAELRDAQQHQYQQQRRQHQQQHSKPEQKARTKRENQRRQRQRLSQARRQQEQHDIQDQYKQRVQYTQRVQHAQAIEDQHYLEFQHIMDDAAARDHYISSSWPSLFN